MGKVTAPHSLLVAVAIFIYVAAVIAGVGAIAWLSALLLSLWLS